MEHLINGIAQNVKTVENISLQHHKTKPTHLQQTEPF